MSINSESIRNRIVCTTLVNPRDGELVDAEASDYMYHEALGRTVIATIVLDDGGVFVGSHTAPDAANYDPDIGADRAMEAAIGFAIEAIQTRESYPEAVEPSLIEPAPFNDTDFGTDPNS